jgi:hypothetical protein
MYKLRILSLLLVLSLAPLGAVAQIEVSGLADLVFRNTDQEDVTNLTFRNFSNFHTSRARLFFDAAVAENTYMFTQILMDNSTFQLYAAYARFTNLAGPYLNVQAGLIPTTVGSYVARAYSNRSPLIGTPLLYNAHTVFNPGGNGTVRTTEDLVSQRVIRDNHGLPLIYDACWNTGIEAYGNAGKLAYSLGLLSGSLSKPMMQQEKNIPQVTTHLTYYASPALDFGMSAFYGPYLADGTYADSLPAGKDAEEFMSGGAGYEFHYSRGHLEVYSEAYYAFWQHPWLADLTATSGYLEIKYALDVQWWLAGRFGFIEPGNLTDAIGNKVHWDYPIKRFEVGIGYKVNRNVLMKLVTQINRFEETDVYDSEHYALQLAVTF